MPMAVPSRWLVPRMPLAVPASWRGTVASTKSWFGAIVMPVPTPASSSGPTRSQPLVARAVRWITSTVSPRPISSSVQPSTSTFRPSHADSLSLLAAATSVPTENGAITRPVISAEWPRPTCHRIDSVKKTLLNPPKNAMAKIAPAENEVCRSRPGLSSGSPPRLSTRSSQAASAANAITQQPKQTQVQAGQPSCWPSTSGTSRSSSPPVSRLSRRDRNRAGCAPAWPAAARRPAGWPPRR